MSEQATKAPAQPDIPNPALIQGEKKLPVFQALMEYVGFDSKSFDLTRETQSQKDRDLKESEKQPRAAIAGYGATGVQGDYGTFAAEFDQNFKLNGVAVLPAQLPATRLERIPIFRIMMKDPVIGIALKQHTGTALSYSEEKQHSVEVLPNTEAGFNENSAEIRLLKDLHARINLDDHIFSWGLNAGGIGDLFLRVYASEDNKRIESILDDESTLPEYIFAYEQLGRTRGYICPLYSKPVRGGFQMLNPWEMIHARLPGNRVYSLGRYEISQELNRNWERFDITLQTPPSQIVETYYGDSMLSLSYWAWKNFIRSLESVMVSRVNKSIRDRAVFLGMTGGAPEAAMKWINNLVMQLINKKKRDETLIRNNDLAHTVNNLVLPYDYSGGQGKVDFSVIDPDVNIRELEDIMVWLNILCGSLGIDRTNIGWADAVTASLGRDSTTMTTIIQALHAERLRRAMGLAVMKLDMIELTYQTGKVYVDPPHILNFHSISVAKEQAELDNMLLRMDLAERVANIVLAAETGDKKLLMKLVNSKIMKLDESEFNAIIDATPAPAEGEEDGGM
ncbi:hypothetical protein KKI24_12980 [bacterium]|nr:hypothetical protein [bacterium]